MSLSRRQLSTYLFLLWAVPIAGCSGDLVSLLTGKPEEFPVKGSIEIRAIVKENGQVMPSWDGQESYTVARQSHFTQQDFESFSSFVNDDGEPVLLLRWKKSSIPAWAAFTEKHVKKKVAFVVTNKVVMAPVVQEKIDGPEIEILAGGGKLPHLIKALQGR